MGSPYLRMMGLFDPYKSIPQGIGLGNMGNFDPYSQRDTVKQGSVFSAPQISMPAPVTPPDESPVVEEGPDYLSQIERIYKMISPENQMSGRLAQMIDMMPVREEPGFLRRLGGLMAGLSGGPEAQEAHMYRPYNRAMEDWKAKFGPTLQAGQLERAENTNERLMTASLMQNMIRQSEADRRLQQGNRRLDIQEDLASIRRFLAENRDWHLEDSGDGYIWRVNARTGQEERTNILTNSLTPEEYASLQIRTRSRTSQDPNDRRNWDIRSTTINGKNYLVQINDVTGEVRGLNAYIGANGEIVSAPQSQTQTTPAQPTPDATPPPVRPGSRPSVLPEQEPSYPDVQVTPGQIGDDNTTRVPLEVPMQPTQQTVNVTNKAEQFRNQNRELGRFVNVDQRGNVTITPPNTKFGYHDPNTPTYAAWRLISQAIYGTPDPPAPPGYRPGGVWIESQSGPPIYQEPR